MEVPVNEMDAPAAGFGIGGNPDFWIGGEGGVGNPVHVAITAKDRAAVDAFYKAAIAAGGKDNGAPGLRPQYRPELLRRVRARSRRAQYRGGLLPAGVSRRKHAEHRAARCAVIAAWPSKTERRSRSGTSSRRSASAC